jgi:hypothetical protein
MKKIIIVAIAIIVFSAFTDGLHSVVTSKTDELAKKYRTFILVDKATNFVMAKDPVQYDPQLEMPLCYFTIEAPIPGQLPVRIFTIHNLVENNADEYDWVLEHNPDEKDMFFARSRFVLQGLSKQWFITVRSDDVVIQNLRTREYLHIDKTGDFSPVADVNEASSWKLIHVF